MNYITKIDGCRAVAVLAVLVSHYFPEGYLVHEVPMGTWGVQLFFVLSGYLITRILLHSRDKLGESGTKMVQLRIFYIRRMLRIFPAYYALLVIYLVLGVEFEGGSFWSCLFYVYNIHHSIIPGEYPYLGHLWTLCIEEQFYLIWPWLMLFVPRRMIVPLTLSLVLFAPVSRLLLSGLGLPYLSIRNLPTSQLDSLCGGALIAQFQYGMGFRIRMFWSVHSGKLALAGVAMAATAVLFRVPSAVDAVIALSGPAVISMFIVDQISLNRLEKVTGFLDWAPLRFIGKISYGIYLYQFVSLFVLYKMMTMAGNPEWMGQDYVFVFFWACTTVLIAAASWKFFESPVCGLKRAFRY